MPLDTPHDPVTGEIKEAPSTPPPREPTPMPDFEKMLAGEDSPAPDFMRFTERQLLVYLAQRAFDADRWRAGAGRLLIHIAQQNHDIADSQLSILDISESLTGTTEELLAETRGESGKKDGKNLNESVDQLTAALEKMTEEMRTGRREIPVDTAARAVQGVKGVLELLIAAGEGAAPQTPEAAPGGAEQAAEPAPAG